MKTALIFGFLLLLSSCGSRTNGNKAPQEKEQLCGGYTAQRAITPTELELFKKATDTLEGVLYTPQSVATQVVAGVNYHFICEAAAVTREPQLYQAAIIIYQPLPGQGEPRITKITKL